MAHGHIVGDGLDGTGITHADVMFFAGVGVHAQQYAAVCRTGHALQQLAFAAAGSAFVHHHHLVFIGRDDPGSRSVGRHPALLLADVQQHRINAFFGRGARVEVVGKHLVQVGVAAVDADLLAFEMGVTEGRSHIDDGPGDKAGDRRVFDVDKRLELGHGKGEESGVSGADQ